MKIAGYSIIKKWRFLSAAYVILGTVSFQFGILFTALLVGKLFLHRIIPFSSVLFVLCSALIIGTTSFLLWNYMKKNGDASVILTPLSVDCPINSFSSLSQTIAPNMDGQLKTVGSVLYGKKRKFQRRTRVFLLDLTKENYFDKAVLFHSIRAVYNRLSLTIPKTNSEARNCFRIVVCVFSQLPESAEAAAHENVKKTIYDSYEETVPRKLIEYFEHLPLSRATHFAGKAIPESTLTVFFDLGKQKLLIPSCRTHDPATMAQYDYCVKQLSHWLL